MEGCCLEDSCLDFASLLGQEALANDGHSGRLGFNRRGDSGGNLVVAFNSGWKRKEKKKILKDVTKSKKASNRARG